MTKTATAKMINRLLKFVLFSLLMILQVNGFSQQLVKTPKDLLLICAKEEQFISKPLSALFKEFKPPIKLAFREEGWRERLAHFTFFFASKNVFDRYRRQDKFPIHVTVFLKETFTWTWEGRDRSLEHYMDWLKGDEEKYSNLTIVGISVGGEYDPCDDEQDVYL